MAASPQTALSGLARALLQHGRIKEADALAVTSASVGNSNGFAAELVSRGLMRAVDIALFGAEAFGFPLLDLSALDDTQIPRDAVDAKLMAKHQVIGLMKRNNRITVGLADPTNLRALDEIRFQTGMAVDPVLVEVDKLAPLLARLTESTNTALNNLSSSDDFDLDGLNGMETDAGPETPDNMAEVEK